MVLAILALAFALVLPAVLRARIGDQPLQSLVECARAAAAARGEIIYLRIEPTGVWHMVGGGSPLEGDSASGRIAPVAAMPLTLLVAPSGSCAFDVRSAAAAGRIAIDPLTCTLRLPARSTSS